MLKEQTERQTMQVKTSRKTGFTLVEIMIVVAIIGLLAAIAIPNFVKARTTAQQKACIANLKQIDAAKEQWALETKKTQGEAVTDTDVDTYLKNSARPNCPSGGTYSYNVVGINPTCDRGSTLGHTL
jgi:prepilin-type N-terminal cleavage/methylation domain-containing protein